MKWKVIFGVVAVFAFLGVLGSIENPHQQVAGIQTVISPTATPTFVPTNTPTPTPPPTPIYIPPTDTPAPAIDNSVNQSQTTDTSACAGATALCADGTCSYAVHHQGACSHHGGVAEWY